MKLDKIAILGTGVMGTGMKKIFAAQNFDVSVWMHTPKIQLEIKGVTYTDNIYKAVEDACLVIEAVTEDYPIKFNLFREVERNIDENAIIATNTSSLSINELSHSISHPERFVGMHFFNPATSMKLVEITPGIETNLRTIGAIKLTAEILSKTPIILKQDSPGFIVNRILIPYINEAIKLLDNKWTMEQIDAAMMFKAGMPMGPFALADYIGLDIVHAILLNLEKRLASNYYHPAKHLTNLCWKGKFGRKTGEGFYKERVHLSEKDGRDFPTRLLINPLVSEAKTLIDKKIACASDIDKAMKFGANFTNGPFELERKLI